MSFADPWASAHSYGPKTQTGWRLITPSAGNPLDIDDVKLQLRIDGSDEDTLIAQFMDAAVETVESRGRLLTTQTWEMLVDHFPCDIYTALPIWRGPVQSVDFIQYVDAGGVTQTWDDSLYSVFKASNPARILPAFNEVWPVTRYQPEAVIVRFTGGYNSSPPTLPVRLTQAMKLLIGHFYENRESVLAAIGSGTAIEIPQGFEWLIDSAIRSARVY